MGAPAYNKTCPKFQARQQRFNRWVNLFMRIKGKVKRGDWSKAKGEHWLRFITPPPRALHWTEHMHELRLARGPMASHINPHTGEHNSRQL